MYAALGPGEDRAYGRGIEAGCRIREGIVQEVAERCPGRVTAAGQAKPCADW